ncbi:MAG: Rrf2 family transcriptional regulator [Planctomycetota bacterium]
MAVSQTADYALRAVVWLAHTWAPQGGAPQTAPQLAEATGVPASYLPKVLQPLIRCGILGGQRGLHGGYYLQIDPASISVLDVLRCVDPTHPEKPGQSEPGEDASITAPGLRALNQLLHTVLDDEQRRFAETPIASLLNEPHAA